MILRAMLTISMLLFCKLSWGEAADHYNRVSFQSEASREVSNDLLVARMSVEVNDKLPTQVAQKINSTINAALKKAAKFSTVKSSTGDQNTEAIHDKKQQLIGYRGHAEIRLESRDFDATSELISQLEANMQLAEIDFSIAPETHRQIEDLLLAEAIDSYRKRAELMRGLLNGSAYKLVYLDINHRGDSEMQDKFGAVNMLGFSGNRIAKQTIAGGKSVVRIQVTSTIEITP